MMIADHVDKALGMALNEEVPDQMNPAPTSAFQVGFSYEARSACNYDCVWTFEVVARTAKFLTIVDRDGEQRRVGVRVWQGVESASPLGTYSMAPVIRSDRQSVNDVSAWPFPLIECCPECGDDTYLSSPCAQPGAPDFGEYECPAGHAAYIPERVKA